MRPACVVLVLVIAAGCGLPAFATYAPSNYATHCDMRTASAMAVSIVFSVCNGSITAVSQAIATASVSGCGDIFAAGIGVGVSSVTPDVHGFVANAFTASLTIANSKGAAASAAAGLAIAIASIDPTTSIYPVDSLLDDVAVAAQNTAVQTGSCQAATQITVSFYKTLISVAPSLAPKFAQAVSKDLKNCPVLRLLGVVASMFSSDMDKLVISATKPIRGGSGCGRITKPLFNSDIQRTKSASAVAVSIANVTCTANGGSIAAIAIATASVQDGHVAANAIAAAVLQNVDLTTTVTSTFLQPAGASRNAAIASFAEALIITSDDATAQTRLAAYISAAMQEVVRRAGCDVADSAISILATALAGSPALIDKLCNTIPAGSVVCGSAQCIWRQ